MYRFDSYLRSTISEIVCSDGRALSIQENRPMQDQQTSPFLGYLGLAQWSFRGHIHFARRCFQNTNALSRQLSYNSAKNENVDENLCWGFRKREEILELLESEHRIAWQLVSVSISCLFCTVQQNCSSQFCCTEFSTREIGHWLTRGAHQNMTSNVQLRHLQTSPNEIEEGSILAYMHIVEMFNRSNSEEFLNSLAILDKNLAERFAR
jgi:hypothetical protein